MHLRDVTAQRSTQRDTWTFHSMIMHKLNTPLQTMLGSLEMLSAEYLTKLSAQEVIDLARYAYKGGQRLSSTITDILQYLKAPIIAHTGEGVRIDELSTLIEQIGGALGITLQITRQIATEEQRLILARRAVECMLWELLENTQKFHPDHQPQVEVAMADTATNRLKLSVMDDGVNLSLEQISKAWSPYYQGEKYHTGEIPGVGLGLSMVAALVWETGGECQLRNRTDRPGVIVDLTLPLG